MAIITIVNEQYTHNYTISLTDQKTVWAQRKFRVPQRALSYVGQLQALGHKEAFSEAVSKLVEKAGGRV